MQNYGKGFLWSHLVPNLVSPCTRPWHTLYQTLVHLVPYPAKPCAKLCNTLYQALLHLVPDPGTPCTRLGHTLYQSLSHLVPNGPGRIQTHYKQTHMHIHRHMQAAIGASRRPGEARPFCELKLKHKKKTFTVKFLISGCYPDSNAVEILKIG